MKLIRSYERLKVADILRKQHPRKVCLIFWHGLGDLVMFVTSFYKMRKMFPDVQIDIALQNGTGQEALIRDAILVKSPNRPIEEYDYTFQIHYPMSEHMQGRWTKNEWCCLQELGVDPIASYPKFRQKTKPSKVSYGRYMVGLHFQATALPNDCNPTKEVAYKIWKEVEQAGFIPVEAFFKHAWYNPVNEKFDFIPGKQTVREIPASIPKLTRLLQSCYASVCVASGNLPMSLAIMPDKTLYLEKEFRVESYTKQNISSINIDGYSDGFVKKWLESLK